jgi:hypothetical protein
MKFVLNRNYVLASLFGHSIRFAKGEPTHVPPECYKEAVSIGAIPESEVEMEESKPAGKPEPTDPVARQAALFAAFETIALRGAREDFTAGGTPRDKALEAELGWKVSSKERDAAWLEFQTKADEGDK